MEEPSDYSPPPDVQRFNCRGCEKEIDVPIESLGTLVRCPHCGTQFFAAEDIANQDVVDDTSEPDSEIQRHDDELNSNRIHQFSSLRRGAIRARSWCLIAVVVCIVGAIQLVIWIVQDIWRQHRWGWWATLYLLLIAAALKIAITFSRKAREFKREIDKPMLEEPAQPPNFSTLSDGSQHWKNLENMK